MELVAYAFGFIVLLVFWLLYRILTGKWNPWKLVEGADGRPSTSKFQWFLWTVVVIFSYTTIFVARARTGDFEIISNIPQNLLVAMGLSVTTMAAAKGITVSQLTIGRVTKTKVNAPSARLGFLVLDDDGFPDLSKIQMVAWTLIAIGVYFIRLQHEIHTASFQLPEIDSALMVLMGLGQGAYLGKKLTTTKPKIVPKLTGLSPGSGKPQTEVMISGDLFGEKQNGSLLLIDDKPLPPEPLLDWHNTMIKFIIPAKQSDGSDWLPGQRITIGVIVDGQESTNRLPFTITKK